MQTNKILAFILIIIALFSVSYSIDNATIGNVVQTRWTNNATAGSSTTQGGNISTANISVTLLTNRWAAYSGNVTGTIKLTDGSSDVYSWNWQPSNGGKICLSTNQGFNFATLLNATVGNITSGMNTAWSFGAATDNATNTYNASSCPAFNFVQASVASGTASAKIAGSSTFVSCAMATNLTPSAKTQFAFCSQVNSTGLNYKNNGANYEVMVPTPYVFGGANTETYYFYAELS